VKFLTWQNPEQLIVAQEFIKIFKILSCGIKVINNHSSVIVKTVMLYFVFSFCQYEVKFFCLVILKY